MADWIVCPSCSLKHSRRPSGTCPKCQQPVDGNPGAAVASAPGDVYAEAPRGAAPQPALGSLAQSARGAQLKSARGILLFIGVMSLLVNAVFFSMARATVDQEFDKEIRKLGPGFVVDEAKLAQLKDEALSTVRLMNAGGALLGIAFLVCAALVQKHPVPVTITALVLYIGGTAVFGMLEPESLLRGLVVKAIIVIALFKAVGAAQAYAKEEELQRAA